MRKFRIVMCVICFILTSQFLYLGYEINRQIIRLETHQVQLKHSISRLQQETHLVLDDIRKAKYMQPGQLPLTGVHLSSDSDGQRQFVSN